MPASPGLTQAGHPPPPLPGRAGTGLCRRLLQPLRLPPELCSRCDLETPRHAGPWKCQTEPARSTKPLLPGKGGFGFSVEAWCCNLSFPGCNGGENISSRALHQQISLPHPGPWAGITLRAPTLHPSSTQALAAGFKTPPAHLQHQAALSHNQMRSPKQSGARKRPLHRHSPAQHLLTPLPGPGPVCLIKVSPLTFASVESPARQRAGLAPGCKEGWNGSKASEPNTLGYSQAK